MTTTFKDAAFYPNWTKTLPAAMDEEVAVPLWGEAVVERHINALDNMTVALARALGPQIRLLSVSPGAVETDFVAGRGHDQLVKLAEATPLKRVVQPEDVAKSIMAFVPGRPPQKTT